MPTSLFPNVIWPGFDGLHVEIPVVIEAVQSAKTWRKALELGNKTWPYATLKEVDKLPQTGPYIICREVTDGNFPTPEQVGGAALLPCTAAHAWGGMAYLFGPQAYGPAGGKMHHSIVYVDPGAHWGDHLLHSAAHELWGHGVLGLADMSLPEGEPAVSLMDYTDVHSKALDRSQMADVEVAKRTWGVKKDRVFVSTVFPEGVKGLVVYAYDAVSKGWLRWDSAAPEFARGDLKYLELGMGLQVFSEDTGVDIYVSYRDGKRKLVPPLCLIGWPPMQEDG